MFLFAADVFNLAGRLAEKKRAKDPQRPPMLREDCCFSIIHGRENKSLDLVASDPETAATWVRGFKSLMTVVHAVEKRRSDQQWELNFLSFAFQMPKSIDSLFFDFFFLYRWLKLLFNQADKDGSGALSFDECCQLLLQLNMKIDPEAAMKLFQVAQTYESIGAFLFIYSVLSFCFRSRFLMSTRGKLKTNRPLMLKSSSNFTSCCSYVPRSRPYFESIY